MTQPFPEIRRPDLAPEDSIVILTGAGISKESGLDTFRDADGIWKKVRLEDVATPEGFARDPDRVPGAAPCWKRTWCPIRPTMPWFAWRRPGPGAFCW
jgi:hypothetical protein